jgi:hypothetical protein
VVEMADTSGEAMLCGISSAERKLIDAIAIRPYLMEIWRKRKTDDNDIRTRDYKLFLRGS